MDIGRDIPDTGQTGILISLVCGTSPSIDRALEIKMHNSKSVGTYLCSSTTLKGTLVHEETIDPNLLFFRNNC